jgi:ubiquinol oxidase
LTLNASAIWEREAKHYGGSVISSMEGPWIIKLPYLFLCYMLDTIFEGRYVPSRFLLLETVARMPYFSYIGMLHMYETLGFWRRSADVKRIHFAQELNEFRHLLIMESLGGDQLYWVRFMAQHSAIFYFLGLCLLFVISPSLSYQFSEWLETHAVNTYGQFVDENEELLKELPPSLAAVEYYVLGASDPYYAEFQTSSSFLSDAQREVREGAPVFFSVLSAPTNPGFFCFDDSTIFLILSPTVWLRHTPTPCVCI